MFAGKLIPTTLPPSTESIEASINNHELVFTSSNDVTTPLQKLSLQLFTPVDFTGSPTDNTVLHFLKPKHLTTLLISYTQPELRQSPQSSRCLQLLKAKTNVSNPLLILLTRDKLENSQTFSYKSRIKIFLTNTQ